ncbi:glycosyltransferase family 4 protein [Desulfoprunum benzoelyticum]|uniref:Glycosyltransferase involved in cell wall biosynthesis n=1 Tax=Desulfoprunum benzoelyticum TaxID=1506996 RepID=A0A840UQL6_9BACT|nr:glycosyltransferase involved in cell wall biosynthesis [Desulfoprunum benzoelyticum]MBM9531596.1 glycosyltransferase family 4 protein [Desulfoprunum benzoelyticum]
MENSLRFIGRELVKLGHHVKIFCFQYSPNEPLQMVHEGIEIIRCPFKPVRWPHAQFLSQVATTQIAIPAVLGEFHPNAVWSRSACVGLGIRRSGYSGPLLQIYPTNARMNCRGLFLQTHGLAIKRRLMLLGLWPLAYFTSSNLERELARKSTAITFSENMRSQLLADFPKKSSDCNVISPGVDTDFFSPENGARYFETIKREYGLRKDETIVLYVGRLSCAKHIPMLMDAFSLLKVRAKLVLVGSGPEKERLQSYASSIGIADRLVFAGTQHEMLPGFYAISRVCVLPTTIESFGQVYLESLASGTPAVGFAGDGRRILTATGEIIRDGQTGGVVSKVSASAIAEKIYSILSLNDKDYAAMSRYAREDVQERFTWRRFTLEAIKMSGSGALEEA